MKIKFIPFLLTFSASRFVRGLELAFLETPAARLAPRSSFCTSSTRVVGGDEVRAEMEGELFPLKRNLKINENKTRTATKTELEETRRLKREWQGFRSGEGEEEKEREKYKTTHSCINAGGAHHAFGALLRPRRRRVHPSAAAGWIATRIGWQWRRRRRRRRRGPSDPS